MGSLIKWGVGLIVGLVVLIAAAAVILPMVIDPNDYKPQIVQAAKDKLGRDLAIEQDLSLTVFPWLGIETGGVRVGNAAGFEAPNFAEIEQLGLKVKLLPLLSQRVEVDTLLLKGLRLNLEKDKSGKTNWDDLAGAKEEAAAEPDAKTSVDQGDSETAPDSQVSLTIQGIQVEDANISWHDRQSGQQYLLQGVRLVTGTLAPGEDVPVEAAVQFTSNKPAMTLQADLNATVSTDAALAVFTVSGLTLALDAEGEGLPAGGAKLVLQADLSADTTKDTLKLDNLAISGPAMSASGVVSVSGLKTNPLATGSLQIAETNPKTLASMFASPIVTQDPEALTRASGGVSFRYADGALKLDPLKVVLDESTLDGYVHLVDPTGPVIRTRLVLDQIDLDRYMPPAAEDAKQPSPKADTAAKPGKVAPGTDPFAALRPLDFIGEFTIGSLKVGNARMRNVTTKVVSKQGVLTIDPMAADLYEGKFKGAMTLNAAGEKPKFAAKQSLTGIQVGPLLKDVADQDRLQGKGEVHLDVRAVGLTEADVKRTLNGSSRFAFTDGAVKGVNLAQIIREASSRLGIGDDKLETGTPGQTDFSELSGSITITNGVIRNQDLAAKSPLLRVDGRGEVDLPANTIDYLVVTEIVRSLEGQGGKSRNEIAGIPIPVRFTGSLDSPKPVPDLEAALSAKAKAQLEEKKQEVQKKVEEKIQDKVGDALKGLFK
jgi:AsmA protein